MARIAEAKTSAIRVRRRRPVYNSGCTGRWGDQQGVFVNQQDIRELRVGDIMQADWPTLAPDQTVEDTIKGNSASSEVALLLK